MLNQQVRPFTKGIAFAVFGAILFSSKAIFIKLGYQAGAQFMELLVYRGFFSIPVFVAIAVYEGRKPTRYRLQCRDVLSIIGLGFLGYYLSSVLDFYGLNFIPASLERIILYTYPTLVLLFGMVFFSRRIQRVQVVSLGFTYGGLVMVLAFQGMSVNAMDVVKGASFVFLSTISYAIYILFSGEIIPRVGPVRFTSLVMLVSYACIAIHYVAMSGMNVPVVNAQVVVLGMMLGIICTVIPTLCLSQAIYMIGSSNTVLAGGVGPVSTVVFASLILGESLVGGQFFGIAMVLLGVGCLTALSGKKWAR